MLKHQHPQNRNLLDRSVTVTNTPAVSGTSKNVIGNPLSPIRPRPKMQRKMPEKDLHISRLHRDTSADEVLSYIRDNFGITSVDQLEIRKLVKKDRDIST